MGRLQKSTNVYVKWITRRCDAFEDKERNTPAAFFGRAMTVHSEDFEPDSEFGNCLASMGAANERVAALQNGFAESISATWLDSVERSVTIIKEYSVCIFRGSVFLVNPEHSTKSLKQLIRPFSFRLRERGSKIAG